MCVLSCDIFSLLSLGLGPLRWRSESAGVRRPQSRKAVRAAAGKQSAARRPRRRILEGAPRPCARNCRIAARGKFFGAGADVASPALDKPVKSNGRRPDVASEICAAFGTQSGPSNCPRGAAPFVLTPSRNATSRLADDRSRVAVSMMPRQAVQMGRL